MFLTLQQQRFLYFLSVRNPNSRFPLQQQRFLYFFKSQGIPRPLQQQRFLYVFKINRVLNIPYSLQQQRFFISSSISWKLNALTLPQQRFLYIFKSHEIPRYPMGSHGLYHSRDFYMFSSSKAKRTTHLCNSRDFYIFSSGTSQGRHKTLRQQRFLYVFKHSS